MAPSRVSPAPPLQQPGPHPAPYTPGNTHPGTLQAEDSPGCSSEVKASASFCPSRLPCPSIGSSPSREGLNLPSSPGLPISRSYSQPCEAGSSTSLLEPGREVGACWAGQHSLKKTENKNHPGASGICSQCLWPPAEGRQRLLLWQTLGQLGSRLPSPRVTHIGLTGGCER